MKLKLFGVDWSMPEGMDSLRSHVRWNPFEDMLTLLKSLTLGEALMLQYLKHAESRQKQIQEYKTEEMKGMSAVSDPMSRTFPRWIGADGEHIGKTFLSYGWFLCPTETVKNDLNLGVSPEQRLIRSLRRKKLISTKTVGNPPTARYIKINETYKQKKTNALDK